MLFQPAAKAVVDDRAPQVSVAGGAARCGTRLLGARFAAHGFALSMWGSSCALALCRILTFIRSDAIRENVEPDCSRLSP